MIKLQNTKSEEVLEFNSVKDWENYILQNSERSKINRGHLYNVINRKSKSCYGFKLFVENDEPKEIENVNEVKIDNTIELYQNIENDKLYKIKSKRGFVITLEDFTTNEEIRTTVKKFENDYKLYNIEKN